MDKTHMAWVFFVLIPAFLLRKLFILPGIVMGGMAAGFLPGDSLVKFAVFVGESRRGVVGGEPRGFLAEDFIVEISSARRLGNLIVNICSMLLLHSGPV